MKHLIQKQEFEITTTSFQLGQQWENRAQDIMRHVITPVAEACFDRISVPGTVQIIDRLEIDLGDVSNDISENDIRIILTHELTKALEASAGKQKTYAHHSDSNDKATILNQREATIEAFIHFLLHGRLPWWARERSFQFTVDWVENITNAQLTQLRKILQTHKYTRQRLAQQFNDDIITAVVQLLRLQNHAVVIAVWKWLQSISGIRDSHFHAARNEYWSYWISRSAGADEKPSMLIHALKRWIKTNESVGKEIRDLFDNQENSLHDIHRKDFIAVLEELRNHVVGGEPDVDSIISPNRNKTTDRQTSKQKPGDPQQEDADNITKGLKDLLMNDSTDNIILKNSTEVAAEKPKPPSEDVDASGIFAGDAGLVLVHPFLQELFMSCDLLDAQKQWASVEAQQTAVLLLGWIARGETNIPEYELIVPKLFCGMEWEEVMDTSILLKEAHTNTATELMEAVVKHWKAIGNSSVDGLREGFINRQGKITKRGKDWLITVEKKAQDVLLARLPWGFSMIHFKWLNNTLIHVDWA